MKDISDLCTNTLQTNSTTKEIYEFLISYKT